MRKFGFSLLSAAFCLTTIALLRPELAPPGPETEQQRWNRLLQERLGELRTNTGGEEGKGPADAFLFDKIKRMNPATGEVPENALLNAYLAIEEQFGPYNPSAESSNNGLWWDERGPSNVGGRTRAILFDPNDATHKAFFAGGVGGGLWYTPDVTVGSPSWTLISPTFGNVAIGCITYDPSNTQIMYYGTGEGYPNADAQRGAGIYKSTDGGMTWAVLPSTLNSTFNFTQRMEVDASGNLYAGTKGGLQKSTDGGATFYKVLGAGTGQGGDGINDVEIASNGDLYVGIDGFGVYKSDASLGANQGEIGNWVRLTTNFTAGYGRIELADAQSNSNVVYALVEINGGVDRIYKTTNGGTNWSPTTQQPAGGQDFSNGQAWYDLDIECSPTDANRVFVGGLNVYRTTNGGTSWSQTTGGFTTPYIHVDQHYITFRPGNSSHVVFSNDGGIWLTTDGGASFDDKNSGYNVTQFYSLSVDQTPGSNIIIGGTQDNGTQKVASPGIGAADEINGSDGSFCNIDHLHPDTMYMTTQYETVRRTRNGGTTTSSITNGQLDETNTMFINPIELDPNNPNILYQASTSLWRHSAASSGSGSGWQRATATVGQITAIGISKSTPNLVYISSSGGIRRIANANTTNSSFSPPTVGSAPSGYVSCISVDPANGNHIIVTYTSYGLINHVMECTDASLGSSATWRSLQGNLPDLPVNWAVFEPNNPNGLLIGTDLGVFRCTDITQASNQIYWTPERNGLGMVRVDMLRPRYSDNMVFLATHGRGFFSTNSYNLAPTAQFGVQSLLACGGNVQFTDSSYNAPNSWQWDFGDGGTSNMQFPSHTYASSGTYNVQLIVTNPNGSDTTLQTLSIQVLPGATADAGPDLMACLGDSLQLNATGGVSYNWIPAANLDDPTSASPQAYISGDVNYIVTVTDSNGCTDTDTVFVDMQAAPNVWAGQDQTISTPGGTAQLNAQGAVTYSWSPTTGLSDPLIANPVCSVTVTTIYTVTGTNAAGCSRSDQVTVFVNITSVDDPFAQGSTYLFAASPSPFSESTVFSWNLATAGWTTVDVIDLNGKVVALVANENMTPGMHTRRFERREGNAELAPGIYFVRLRSNGQTQSRKILIY